MLKHLGLYLKINEEENIVLEELIKNSVEWPNVYKLLEVYVLKINDLEYSTPNQIQDAPQISFVIGDAIHDIFNNENEGIDFSRIPTLIKEYNDNKNKFWIGVMKKYLKEKESYLDKDLKTILTHFVVLVAIFEHYIY